MRSKWIQRTSLVALVMVICIVALLFYIDRSQFHPFWPDIEKIVGSIPDQELHLAAPRREVIMKLGMSKDLGAQSSIDWRASRELLHEIHHESGMRSTTWQAEWLLWYLEIRARFSAQERFALYCHLMQFKDGNGLLYGSRSLFHEEPNQLTNEQLAIIMVIQRTGYRYYDRHPERLSSDAQSLLASKM